MGIIDTGGIIIHGNFEKIQKQKPKNFHFDRDAKWLEPYPFKWRFKLGKVECDCKEIEVSFQPYYGSDYYHMEDCAIGKHLKRFPGIRNLWEIPWPLLSGVE